MQESELAGLVAQVLWATFALALIFGAVAQRTHFCTMGAVADIVSMGDWTRMRKWLLAIAVATIGFNAMVGLGWVQASDSIYAAPRVLWLSHAVGGLMFGFGMVLASGCGSKTLVRAGAGNLKSLAVFVVLAVSSYATLRGVTAVLRVSTVDAVGLDLPVGQDLPSLAAHVLGGTVQAWALALGAVIGLVLLTFVLARAEGRRAEVWVSGLGIGGVIVGVWWVTGRMAHLSEHPLTLEAVFLATNSQRMESLSFVGPLANTLDWLIRFSDKSNVLTVGVVATFGVALGSMAMALASGTFRWEGFGGTEDTANHLVGASLMGVGGVTALGCTVGQGLSGISTLALGSFIAVAGIVAGGVLGVRWQIWRLERGL